jgi:uroporphyrinogen-III synthase
MAPRQPCRNSRENNSLVNAASPKSPASSPLRGKRVLVSRAKAQAGALSKALRELGADVLEIPFIEIREPTSWRPLDDAILSLADYDWLILTSVNGVRALFARMEKLGREIPDLMHLKVAAIGPATRNAILKRGLAVDVMPDEYVAESVVKSLREEVGGKRVLLVRAKIARDVIPVELRQASAQVDVIEAYETVIPKSSRRELLAALRDRKRRPDIITFTSSSTVRHFVELLGKEAADAESLQGVKLASIGPVTSATLRELSLRVDIEAGEYTIPGLVAAIAKSV